MAIPFPDTRWSRILKARADGFREAIDYVAHAYREPILGYLRRRGLPPQDAEDLAQEVFVQLSNEALLQGADRSKGRFRTLLLRITQHVVTGHFRGEHAEKRGGGRLRVPIDTLLASVPDKEAPDPDFDREWAHHIVRRAMDRLREECEIRSKPYHEVLRLNLSEGLPYPRIAERLGKTEHDVAYYVRQAKARLKRLILAEITDYCSTPGEYRDELRDLSAHLFTTES